MRGTIRKRIATDGTPRYDCMFRAHGRQVSKTFTTKKAADDFLSSTASNVAAGTYRRITLTSMGNVFAQWQLALEADMQLGVLKRSTFRGYRSVLTQHLVPAFGYIRSDDLANGAIADWKTQQAAKIAAGTLAAKTHNNIIGVAKVCFDWAVEQKMMPFNPLPKKKLRAKTDTDERLIVQGAEINRLWAATDGQDRLIIALALFAGLRRGEVFGARWQDVTWPKGRHRATLRIVQAFVQRQIVTPKTAAGKRIVYLPARLVALLRDHERERPVIRLDNGHDFLIRQDDGQPIDPDNWTRRVWPTIRTAAKLPAAVTLHGLRHTYGSLLLADGAPVKHVAEQMGHANPTITMAVYQHVLRATSATATRQLDRHIPGEPAKKTSKLRLVKTAAA